MSRITFRFGDQPDHIPDTEFLKELTPLPAATIVSYRVLPSFNSVKMTTVLTAPGSAALADDCA